MKSQTRVDARSCRRTSTRVAPTSSRSWGSWSKSRPSAWSPSARPTCSAARCLAAQYIAFLRRPRRRRADRRTSTGARRVQDRRAAHVTIYNHLDVQPAAHRRRLGARTRSYSASEDGRYEGRGTTDDKGPALTALFAARYAAENGVPLNFRFLWEMEEEIGSPHFESFVKSARTRSRPIRSWCRTRSGSRAASRRFPTVCAACSRRRCGSRPAPRTCTRD